MTNMSVKDESSSTSSRAESLESEITRYDNIKFEQSAMEVIQQTYQSDQANPRPKLSLLRKTVSTEARKNSVSVRDLEDKFIEKEQEILEDLKYLMKK